MGVNIDTTVVGSKVAVVRLDGRLNMVSAQRLRQALDEVVESGTPFIVVDMTDVAFMDSSGLGALIGSLKRARERQGDLRLCAVTDQVATVLKLTNLDRVLRLYPTVEAATDAW